MANGSSRSRRGLKADSEPRDRGQSKLTDERPRDQERPGPLWFPPKQHLLDPVLHPKQRPNLGSTLIFFAHVIAHLCDKTSKVVRHQRYTQRLPLRAQLAYFAGSTLLAALLYLWQVWREQTT